MPIWRAPGLPLSPALVQNLFIHTPSLTHAHSLSLTRTHTHSLSHTHTLSLTHTHTHSLTHSHTHSHTLSLTHSLTHTHTHVCSTATARALSTATSSRRTSSLGSRTRSRLQILAGLYTRHHQGETKAPKLHCTPFCVQKSACAHTISRPFLLPRSLSSSPHFFSFWLRLACCLITLTLALAPTVGTALQAQDAVRHAGLSAPRDDSPGAPRFNRELPCYKRHHQ